MKAHKIQNDPDLQRLRERLQRTMEDRDLSPALLAAKAVVPLSTVMRVLSGEVKNPGIDVIVSLARALGISLYELVEPPASEQIRIELEAKNRPGVLHQIGQAFADEQINIMTCFAYPLPGLSRSRILLTTGLTTSHRLDRVINTLEQYDDLLVTIVQRGQQPTLAATLDAESDAFDSLIIGEPIARAGA